MASALKLGSHWAVIETAKVDASDMWIARWALYKNLSVAMETDGPKRTNSVVSGRTRAFHLESSADNQAHTDAARTEKVLSGINRQGAEGGGRHRTGHGPIAAGE